MRSNGGIIGGKKALNTSVASGIWAIRDQQREKGASNWPITLLTDLLIVGGGQGGGCDLNPGGGGGGVLYMTGSEKSRGVSYSIVIGAGGAAASSYGLGTTGIATSALGETAGPGNGGVVQGLGGSSGTVTITSPNYATALASTVYTGGTQAGNSSSGGGGAGGVGGNRSGNGPGGAGGIGIQVGTIYNDSNNYYWGGGGGGPCYDGTPGGAGGLGGGGGGGVFAPETTSSAGTGGGSALNSGISGVRANSNLNGGAGGANTGGGGGGGGHTGAGYTSTRGGSGGSGIAVLRYLTTAGTITIGAGLTGSTATYGLYKVTTITAGSGNVSWA